MHKKLQPLFDKMENTRKELFQKLEQYPAEKMNQKPDEKSWSVVQVMDHLTNAEGNSVKYINKKLSFNPKLQKAGLGSSARYALLVTAFTLPLKFKVPDVVGEASNEHNFAQAKANWDQVRNDLKTLLDSMDEKTANAELWKHPAAGKMSMKNALKFMELHVQRHQGQIDRILKAVA